MCLIFVNILLWRNYFNIQCQIFVFIDFWFSKYRYHYERCIYFLSILFFGELNSMYSAIDICIFFCSLNIVNTLKKILNFCQCCSLKKLIQCKMSLIFVFIFFFIKHIHYLKNVYVNIVLCRTQFNVPTMS